MRQRRIKIKGQNAVYPWHFGDDYKETQEERVADILADCKKEVGYYWTITDDLKNEVVREFDNIKVIYHKHNGRVQRFSVYTPKSLLDLLKIADEEDKLFPEWCRI